jgi:phenylacetate-coenzyme A ligase PaaK-like adenylate-forming protein
MEIEPLLNTPRMREIQWKKLQEAIRYCYEKVPFDRKRMEKAGVEPEDIHLLTTTSGTTGVPTPYPYRSVRKPVRSEFSS